MWTAATGPSDTARKIAQDTGHPSTVSGDRSRLRIHLAQNDSRSPQVVGIYLGPNRNSSLLVNVGADSEGRKAIQLLAQIGDVDREPRTCPLHAPRYANRGGPEGLVLSARTTTPMTPSETLRYCGLFPGAIRCPRSTE